MKLIPKTSANFEAAQIHLQVRQHFVNNMPECWQSKLQKVLGEGGFLKFEACLLAGGQVDSKLILVSNVGEVLELTPE